MTGCLSARDAAPEPTHATSSSGTDLPASTIISLLVVSWKTPALTSECVCTALRELGHLPIEVVVVDNNSGDGTVSALRAAYGHDDRVTIVANDSNRGYAGGNNQALDLSRGSIIAVVNPDISLARAPVESMLEHLISHNDVGVVSGCLVGHDGRPQTLHRHLPTLGNLFFVHTHVGAWLDHRLLRRRNLDRYKLRNRPRTGAQTVEQIAGAFFLIRRTTIAGLLGGVLFDEGLPILVNDIDLCRRVRDAGLRSVVLWDSVLRHQGGASLSLLDQDLLDHHFWSGMERYVAAHDGRAKQLATKAIACVAAIGRPRTAHPASPPAETRPVTPTASIVIPAYNYARFLPVAIESALAQDWSATEVIVVDDGSTDDTLEVVERYAGRIRSVRQPNRGLSAARNRGAAMATGDYVVFLDADDRLAPRFVSECIAALETHPAAGFAFTQVRRFGGAERAATSLPDYDLERLLDGNEIAACALIRRELVLGHPYDEANRTGWEDWDFWLTLAEHGWGGTVVDQPLVEYREHDHSMTGAMSALDRRRMTYRILRRHRRLAGSRRVRRAWYRYRRLQIGLARRGALDALRRKLQSRPGGGS